MRNDILERKDDIIKWIKESNNTITHREICKRLKCRVSTMHTYFAKMGIEYTGNSALKNIRVIEDKNYFIKNSTRSTALVKERIIQYKLLPYKCAHCDIKDTWNGQSIKLHLDHINGDNRDNRLDNLRFLCPNCHSQTETYCGKGINKGNKKVSDEDLITALNENESIRKALMSVGLTPKGANYDRCWKLKGTII